MSMSKKDKKKIQQTGREKRVRNNKEGHDSKYRERGKEEELLERNKKVRKVKNFD